MAARRTNGDGTEASGVKSGSGCATSASEGANTAATAKENHEFVSEAEEILERLFEDLSDLHEQRHADREVEPDLVNRIFRSAHSMKGLAGMFGQAAIIQLAHRMEDVLDGLRLGRVSLQSPVIELLDEGVSLLATIMARIERGEVSDADESAKAEDFVTRIDAALLAPVPVERDELAGLDLDPSLLRALTEYEEHRLRESIRRGRHLMLVDSSFEIVAFEDGLSAITAALREVGEVVSTLPSPGSAPESQIRFSLLVATEMGSASLAALLDFPATAIRDVGHVGAASGSPVSVPVPIPVPGSPEPAPRAAAPKKAAPRKPARAEAEAVVPARPRESCESSERTGTESLRSISDTVRVDIRKLDELMNLVGELAIQRGAIGGVAQRLLEDPHTARIGAELAKTHKALDRKLKDLQGGVLDVRMVPLRQIFEKLSRVVRRLRRDLDKQVEFEFKGADTELDKLIVEQLVDPLVHIVRNAFDHALESPLERADAGKDPVGSICISALQRGNHVVIEVSDDGRGMDVAAIHQKALATGLISESDTLSQKQILNLVFEAGLSTAVALSATSGRGVGMDVVRSNLSEMGGMVDLTSEPGLGTTVTITLPITLAIIQALLVGVGEECFAIPLGSVLETMVVEPDQIRHSEGRELLNLRGEPLLLRRLCEEFEIAGGGREDRQFVVVLGLGAQRLGLLVDRLEGQRDAVIKSIKGPVQSIRGIAGATELGERGAILVIDVSAIAADVLRRREVA